MNQNLMLLGAGMLVCSAALPARIATVSDSRLQEIAGGQTFACALPSGDPNGLHCDECTSDGNGGSIKCDSTGADATWTCTPTTYWTSLDETNCDGTAQHYGAGDTSCSMNFSPETCFRTFTKATSMFDPGLTCGDCP